MAEVLKSHPEDTGLFLDDLVACDLVIKKDGTYWNTAIAQEFLMEGSQTFMGPMLTITKQTFFTIDDLPKLVRKGPPLPTFGTDLASSGMWAQFVASMANAERAGAAQQSLYFLKWIQK